MVLNLFEQPDPEINAYQENRLTKSNPVNSKSKLNLNRKKRIKMKKETNEFLNRPAQPRPQLTIPPR